MFSYLKQGKAFYKNLIVLCIPMILQNLVTTSLAIVDTFMVGMLGETPLAAVTLANLPIFVIQFVVFGIQSGSAVLISQYWGRRDTDSINRVVGVAAMVAGSAALLFAIALIALNSNLPPSLVSSSNFAFNFCARSCTLTSLSNA